MWMGKCEVGCSHMFLKLDPGCEWELIGQGPIDVGFGFWGKGQLHISHSHNSRYTIAATYSGNQLVPALPYLSTATPILFSPSSVAPSTLTWSACGNLSVVLFPPPDESKRRLRNADT